MAHLSRRQPPFPLLPSSHTRERTHITSGIAGEGGEGEPVCVLHTCVWVSQASAWELAMSAVVDAASAAVVGPAGPPRRRRPRGRRWHQPRCRRRRYVSRMYQTAPRCFSLTFSHKHDRGRLKGGMHRPGRRLR